MKGYLFLILVMALASCNNLPAPRETEVHMPVASSDEQPAQATTDTAADAPDKEEYIDSFKVKMDSLMVAKIDLPPIYKHEIISANNESVAKFSQLAKLSGGRLRVLVNSDLVAKELVHTINTISAPGSDLLLLIDKTGSMDADIATIRNSLSQVIDTVKKYKKTRLAVAFYGDKNTDGKEWFKLKNFETDYEAAREFINAQVVSGGGDWPESVYDAVFKCMESDFWKSDKKRNIILVGDAPPLEKPLSDYGLTDVTNRAKKDRVVMNFYPIIITPAVAVAKVEKAELATYQPLKLSSSVYPNPCKGVINVGFEESGKYYLEIYNAAGEEVVSEETFGLHWTRNLGEVPDGLYILRIIDQSHKFELAKFIVRH